MNSYYLYILQAKPINVAASRVITKFLFYNNFYFGCDFEPSIGTIKYFAYKSELGYEVKKNVGFMVGVMNKFFNPKGDIYRDIDNKNYGMFRLSKKPWLFAEAYFKL